MNIFLLGIIILLIALICFLIINRIKIEEINKNEEQKYLEKINKLKLEYQALEDNFKKEESSFSDNLNSQKEILYQNFYEQKNQLEQEFAAWQFEYNLILKEKEQEKENAEKALNEKILAFQKDRDLIIKIQKEQEQKEKESSFFKLNFSENQLKDIKKILLMTQELSNSQILYKLIWSEYYQKPLKELSLRVLGEKSVSGIYKITNTINGKIYIGRSTNVQDRWVQHIKSALEIGTIAKTQLYKEMKNYGIENFSFELLEKCDKNQLNEKEKYYIALFKTNEWGLNENSGG